MFENLVNTLTELGEEIKEAYKQKLETEGINASGKLSNSVESMVRINGTLYEVVLELEDYWKAIEEGRSPTKNNGDGQLRRAILDWIRVKPVLPRPMDNGKLPTEAQLAYLISRKIHKEGYKGRYPLKRTIEEMRDKIYDEIKEALVKDLQNDVLMLIRTIEGK